MKTFFKEFNENFFKNYKHIKWFDDEGFLKYLSYKNNNKVIFRVIRFTLNESGTKNIFNGYTVEIFDKEKGFIVKKFFNFRNYLTMKHRPNTQECCHVWLVDDKLDWYISTPIDTNEMCEKIFEWIELFK